jgi:Fe(3+) dicitrate transport protein
MSEWIGFPTLYYVPVPQSVSEIQVIRGGSSLLYGPQPAPAINYITKHPKPGSPWHFYAEQTGGPDNTYSSYASVEEANGPIEFRMDGFYRTSETQRDHNKYDLWQANGYVGWRPDAHQLIAIDVHASEFDGEDPGRLTYAQWLQNPDQAVTPFNHNWVDRYTVALRYELEIGDWLVQAKGWYTHQGIDARTAANVNPTTGAFPTSTTFGYEEFNNGGVDLRARMRWGEGTIFRGSALTFGGVAYHGDAPFNRYTLNNANTGLGFLYAPRGTTADDPFHPLDQERTADYQAVFIENVFRLGRFHVVPSFRLDHENVEVSSTRAPFLGASSIGPAQSVSADHWVPLWGIGLGHDFAKNNESYFSASSGWRPTRFFDIAGTTRTIRPGTATPDPFESLDIELGVHGTPFKGFWYDVGLFWMEFSNRTENQSQSAIDFEIVNTGNTRHRGFEGEVAYDFLAPFQQAQEPAVSDDKSDGKTMARALSEPAPHRPFQLVVFGNLQVLDAEFTESGQTVQIAPGVTRSFVGNEPAYAPDVVVKGGITFKRDKCFNVTLSGVYVSEQFWQDSNVGTGNVPLAQIPSYKVFNLSGEFYLTRNVRLIGGVSNLADERYYSRVFPFGNGSIDPAPGRSGYAGLSVEF